MTERGSGASGKDVRQGEPARREAPQPALHGSVAAWPVTHEPGAETPWQRRFDDPSREWRRWFSELFGTFLLVLAGAGAPVVNAFSHGANRPRRGGDRARPHGHGGDSVHGRGLRRAPESSGEHRVRSARRLSLAARARLHPRAARRSDPRDPVPRRDLRRGGHARSDRPRSGHRQRSGAADGAGAVRGSREHDPRHGVALAERRPAVGRRGGRLHRPRRACGPAR